MKLIDRSGKAASGVIAKLRSCDRISYELQILNRFQIGYVISGEKHFVVDDRRLVCRSGELFFVHIGQLCCEDIAPENGGVYEQIILHFNSEEMTTILSQMVIESPPVGCLERSRLPAIFTPSEITRGVIESINTRYDNGGFINTPLGEMINLANLVVSIFDNDSEQLKRIIASCIDFEQVDFQRLIFDNVFANRGLADLAEESNRSLTTFKKDFRRHFGGSPHSWFLHQRLSHAQNLLMITDDSIAHIGAICTFTNTSHFIKLYKSHFGLTPAQHRIQLRKLRF